MTARIPTFLLPSLFRHAILSACLSVVVLAQSTTPPPVYHWTTLAGRASPGQDDGVAALARFNSPHGLATDQSGNLYIADTDNHTVRKITPTGTVSTYAGSPGQAGRTDGTVITARFNGPHDGVLRLVEVLCGVTILGGVAAADVPATLAQA